MIANYSTKNRINFTNVKSVRDAKFFDREGDKPAASTFTIVMTSKGQDADVFVDVWVRRGATLAANVKKGTLLNSIWGRLEFKIDKEGGIRGVLYDAEIETTERLSDGGGAGSAPSFE